MEPIETAEKTDEFDVLLSATGAVWFQGCWDEDMGWCTFNLYFERDPNPPRKFEPKFWAPLPAAKYTEEDLQKAKAWADKIIAAIPVE